MKEERFFIIALGDPYPPILLSHYPLHDPYHLLWQLSPHFPGPKQVLWSSSYLLDSV